VILFLSDADFRMTQLHKLDILTHITYTSYAVSYLEVDSASGRAEDYLSFSQKIHNVNFL